MKINTIRFGEIEVSDERIIFFPEGILGFEKVKKFVFLENEGDEVFKWMQAVNNPELCFLVIEPELFMYNYSLEISDDDVEYLKIKKPEEVNIISIVTVPEDPNNMTANLQGPIIVNTVKRLAKQIISGNPSHKVKVPIIKRLMENMKKIEKKLENEKNENRKRKTV